jgi:hypothetical protein
MVLNRQSQDLYREMRKRILRETEDYLNACLKHPERAVRIPTVVVGHGVFAPAFARSFWGQILGDCSELDPTLRSLPERRFAH